MRRKLLTTSFIAIFLLCSLLLTSCEAAPVVPHLFIMEYLNKENVYELEQDTYSITINYGHKYDRILEDPSRSVGVVACRGYGEDLAPLLEWEILLEINNFYAEENRAEKKVKCFKTTYEPRHFATIEIPKEHFSAEKGFLVLYGTVFFIDETGENYCPPLSATWCVLTYEKKDGKIYTTQYSYKSENYKTYFVFKADLEEFEYPPKQ